MYFLMNNAKATNTGFISADIIKKHIESPNSYFLSLRPPPMMNAIEKHLASLGIKEEYIVKKHFKIA